MEKKEIRLSVSPDDFKHLTCGGVMTYRDIAGIKPNVKLIFSDIGFSFMHFFIDEAEREVNSGTCDSFNKEFVKVV